VDEVIVNVERIKNFSKVYSKEKLNDTAINFKSSYM
jgi:hypothetical protein